MKKPKLSHRLFTIEALEAAQVEIDKVSEENAVRKRARPENIERRLNLLEAILKNPYVELSMAKRSQLRILDGMAVDFPNFQNVIRALKQDLRLRLLCKGSLLFAPMLLVGVPGTGKTEFVRALAERLGQKHLEFSTPSISSTFVLSGGHRTWQTAEPGRITTSVMALNRQGLFVLFDEIDKVQDGRYPVLPKILEFTDPGQATRVNDEFLEMSLDVHPLISWFATANYLDGVSDPMRSRFRVFQIELPTTQQMPAVALSVDRWIRKSMPHIDRWFKPLDASALNALSSMAPRLLRRVLLATYSAALEIKKSGRRYEITSEQLLTAARECEPPKVEKRPVQEEAVQIPMMIFMGKPPDSGGSPPPTFH